MKPSVQAVHFEDVEAIPLPRGSWSRMVLSEANIVGIQSSLGYSTFRPGTITDPVSHAVEELAFVVAGHGELRLEDDTLPFRTGHALHIPARVWHAVSNTGNEDMVMVFTFPSSSYPPSDRR
ncbi:MAG: cupin domain-containing protein [Anaerolineales bacterium]